MPEPVLRQPIPPQSPRLRDQFAQTEGEALTFQHHLILPPPLPEAPTTSLVGASYLHRHIPLLHVAAFMVGSIPSPSLVPCNSITWFDDFHRIAPPRLEISTGLLADLLAVRSDLEYRSIFLGRRLPCTILTDGNLVLWTIQTTN